MVREFLFATYYFLLTMLCHNVCAASGGTLELCYHPRKGGSESLARVVSNPTIGAKPTTNKKVHVGLRFWVAVGKDRQRGVG
jgi:hypothetical protein